MPRKNLVDAGTIIAFLDKDDLAHDWAVGVFSANENRVIRLVTEKILTLEFSAQANMARIFRLMQKYADRPMDFADACLVVMTEESSDPVLFTLDGDFKFYRRHGRDAIPFVSPKH